MTIEWLRDLAVVIFGLVAAGVLVFLAVLAYSLYRRTRSILDSVRNVSKTTQDICSYAGSEVVKPLIQVATLIQGIRQGIYTISKLLKK